MTEEKKAISTDSLMTEERQFPPSDEVVARALINADQYKEMYDRSINQSDEFWMEQSKSLAWFKEPTVACKSTWDTEGRNIKHTWFEDGTLNVTANCLDRHIGTERENKAALIWQGDEIDDDKTITYKELHEQVCKFANVLKDLGVKKGDRVTFPVGMPMKDFHSPSMNRTFDVLYFASNISVQK